MTAEDRLRDLLRSEATTIVPGGDGLTRIKERIARRRRVRLWLVPSAAVATAGVAAAFLLLAPDDHRTDTLQPGASPTVTGTGRPTASASPVPVVPDDGGTPLDVPAIWPFATQSAASSWSTDFPWAQDGLAVGRHFAADYLSLKDVDVTQPCVSCGVLDLAVHGRSVGQLTLARVGVGFASGHGTQVYTVVSVGGTDLSVTAPRAGAALTSPTPVTGRITGVDEHVALRLLSHNGDELATGGAQAGSAVPWSATLTWSRSDWSTGAIVGVTRSMKDGSVNRVVAVPVGRSTASPTATFAALIDGHVALFDAVTGKQVRQLTFPATGSLDSWATWSAGTLAWVRTRGASGCVNELDRLDGGKASTVATSTTASFRDPHLSPSGGLLAYVEAPCDGSAQHVVITGGGGPDRRLLLEAHDASVYDVRDDGTVLVAIRNPAVQGENDAIVPPSETAQVRGPATVPSSGCVPGHAGAFDGDQVVTFETCAGKLQLVRYDLQGRRVSADRAVVNNASGEPPHSVTVRDGSVLVWQFGGGTYGAIARYSDGTFTTLIANAGCTSTSAATGCVGSPDW